MFDSTKLTLETAAFEARYTQGFLYWDRCGHVWKALNAKYPTLDVSKVDTSKAVLKLGGTSLNLQFNTSRLNVAQTYSKDLKQFSQFSKEALEVISEYFDITTFTRVGFRLVFIYPLEDVEDEAVELLQKTGYFAYPTDKLSYFGPKLFEPGIKFGLKDDNIGTTFRLSTADRKVDIEGSLPIKVDTTKFVVKGLVIDLDRYTLKPVDRPTFNASDWIEVNERNIKKAINELFR